MNAQNHLYKGELKEENLRDYFLDLGFYVVRGIVFKYESFEITDIDLWLYHRPSSVSRERINVDIKNKKTPQAIERIFWTKGLTSVLGLDNCIVATTDRRPSVVEFGLKHGVRVLDGSFLSKLDNKLNQNRLSEEEFINLLKGHGKFVSDWKDIYEASKSRLITGLDFSGAISCLKDLKYFYEIYFTSTLNRDDVNRIIYIILSHFLVTVDFILKDLAFYETSLKSQKLIDGFRYGSIGREGVEETLNLAIKISGQSNRRAESIKAIYASLPVEILRDFFIKSENAKNIFKWAKDLENVAFSRTFYSFINSPVELQGLILMLVDYFNLDRKQFYEVMLKQ